VQNISCILYYNILFIIVEVIIAEINSLANGMNESKSVKYALQRHDQLSLITTTLNPLVEKFTHLQLTLHGLNQYHVAQNLGCILLFQPR